MCEFSLVKKAREVEEKPVPTPMHGLVWVTLRDRGELGDFEAYGELVEVIFRDPILKLRLAAVPPNVLPKHALGDLHLLALLAGLGEDVAAGRAGADGEDGRPRAREEGAVRARARLVREGEGRWCGDGSGEGAGRDGGQPLSMPRCAVCMNNAGRRCGRNTRADGGPPRITVHTLAEKVCIGAASLEGAIRRHAAGG